MKLVPTRPVTIHSTREGQRWFPFVSRLPDGSLMMHLQCGYDANFAPTKRWRSFYEGRDWHQESENVPRHAHGFSFPDGTLFEIDQYGFHDPNSPGTFAYFGAWSTPGVPGSPVERATVRIHSPSIAPTLLNDSFRHAYPHFPWWPLINELYGENVKGDDVRLGGPVITDMAQVGDKLLAIGYRLTHGAGNRHSVFCYQSQDKGRTWNEAALVARGSEATVEGFNEATLTVLRDGRLYAVLRSGEEIYHAWSADGGLAWTEPALLRLSDEDFPVRRVWPRVASLADGTLVLAFGRPGKHLVFDPTGTGENWQGRLDLHAWELDTQTLMGVPEEARLRGNTTTACVRYWDSGDYLSVTPCGPREVLVTYDVQNFVENWNADPVAGVRMLRVKLEPSRESNPAGK